MYQYNSSVLPDAPSSFDASNIDSLQAAKQTIVNQEKEIDYLWYMINKNNDEYKTLADVNTVLNTKLDGLQTTLGTGSSNGTADNVLLTQKLDTMISQQNQIISGTNTVVTYGVLYIPLAIILVVLWKFFSQFLKSY